MGPNETQADQPAPPLEFWVVVGQNSAVINPAKNQAHAQAIATCNAADFPNLGPYRVVRMVEQPAC